MRVSFRLRQILGEDADRRGVIGEIEGITGVERHTISALINKNPTSVNLDILGKICEYLVGEGYVSERDIPGALFGLDPVQLWDLLGSCERIEFCLGTRKVKEWQGSRYVMSADSRLQGVLLSRISQAKYGPDAKAFRRRRPPQTADGVAVNRDQQSQTSDGEASTGMRFFSEFHLVPAPGREARPDGPGREWESDRKEAKGVYDHIHALTDNRALIALGSIKVNPVVEMMLGDAFGAPPFKPENRVADARERRSPIFFRCRDDDPQPPSFCGGTKLASQGNSSKPGIYYEKENGTWACCPWSDDKDVAFLFCANKCMSGLVEIACGGYSARSTGFLTDNLEQIVSRLGEPQYDTGKLRLSMHLVTFTRKLAKKGVQGDGGYRDWTFNVIKVPQKAISRRLD